MAWQASIAALDQQLFGERRNIPSAGAPYLCEHNAINRYSIGSRTEGLKKDADGSLTLYQQMDKPEGDKAANWLPTPNAPFFAVLRVYGPGEKVQTGEWTGPPVHKAE